MKASRSYDDLIASRSLVNKQKLGRHKSPSSSLC